MINNTIMQIYIYFFNFSFNKYDSKILQIMDTESFEKLLDVTLNECIQHHIGLLSICKGLVSYYSPLALIKVAFITVYLALNTALLAGVRKTGMEASTG